MLMLEENPHTSSRQTASALNISHSSILRVLTENQMHPYTGCPQKRITLGKSYIGNELRKQAVGGKFGVYAKFDELKVSSRKAILIDEFSTMQMINDNTLQIENVLFSEESTFTLHGHVNRQNCRCWSRENPHWMRELHTQNPEKVNVWPGIIGENIIGHYFIDGNLNGETYLALLQNNKVMQLFF
ncbi:hypothetical protein NQ318_021563 [Aromia moschata]|uniref:Uncharacterized protein n=1 Tax=Aromia moschata TaxID=1265417 RepID=A0AAV8YJQ2_9CUCU|nr:hypothetical protein NQ318_021563 [Aromia moschata]